MKKLKYGLIGEKLGHSFSPEIHAEIADYDYQLIELAPNELDSFMKKREFDAINVTIPYKTAVLPYLDVIHPIARSIGAVNTVKRVGDMLYGYNTDYYGLRELVSRVMPSVLDKDVLILGSGGTSKTAFEVCTSFAACDKFIVGRTARDGVMDYETACRDYTGVDLIINTTPVGMYPNQDGCPIDLSCFNRLSGVVDVVYNPLCSDLVLSARERGIPAEGGLYMLVSQAIHASEIFTGNALPSELKESIFRKILKSKQNIFLIGMPGCGKTTVGKALARELDREFIDTDELIVERDGRSISQIFAESGEQYFRDLEAEAIRAACLKNGAVIATGGGAVLRRENLHAMRRTGKIYFLDRDIKNIVPTDDRPLSLDREALGKRYEERYPLYTAAADFTLAPDESLEGRVEALKKEFLSQ